jgi:SAM-dependent methyltransferase
MKSSSQEWDECYQADLPPWESGRPSSELARVLEEEKITPCRVFELGCGSGVNAVWMAQRGFDVTAVDFSELAINRARLRAAEAGVKVHFEREDVLSLSRAYEPAPFFFDRGCYHVARRTDAAAYVRTLSSIAGPGAMGLLLTGNARCPAPEGQGPPVVSAEELRAELEPAFQIVRMREFYFDLAKADSAPGHLGWSCLLRRAV